MDRKMFSQSLVEGADATQRPLTMTWALLMQIVGVGLLLLAPLIHYDTLGGAMLRTLFVSPPPPVAPPPVKVPQTDIVRTRVIPRQLNLNGLFAPRNIPAHVANIVDDIAPPPEAGIGTTPALLSAAGIFANNLPTTVPAPPPVVKAAPKPAALERLRVGGSVQQGKILKQVQPVYPTLARTAGISGQVVLHAFISKDGTIEELRVISGHPFLVKAALEAVQQWQYRPTFLNGEPARVETEITVNFNLMR